jgi:cytoplasmic iron level regulating protein YaaA (DUF328/UPF0246 family)
MVLCDDHDFDMTLPAFESEHQTVLQNLGKLDYETLKKVYACSDAIAKPAYEQLHQYLSGTLQQRSPALLTYSGIAFQSLGAGSLEDGQWDYLQKHLYVLSAVFGAVKPLDAIHPYRLEMQAKPGFDLYGFWRERLMPLFENETVINLASKEYSKVLSGHPDVIDIHFYEEENGKRKEMSTYAKNARGAMVRWMAQKQIEDPAQLTAFD